MPGSTLHKALSRGVGQRIFGYFLIAAVLPMLFTGWLAYHEFSRGAEREASGLLKAEAKEYGVEILTRLQLADAKADEIIRILEQDGAATVAANNYLLKDFAGISLRDASNSLLSLPGLDAAPFVSAAVPDLSLDDAQPRLDILDNKRLVLTKPLPVDSGLGHALVLELKPDTIWGARDHLPYSAEFCVFSEDGIALYCTSAVDSNIHSDLLSAADVRSSVFAQLSERGENKVAALWQLFLAGKFAADPIDVVAIQDREYALKASAGYWRVFIPAIALVLILVSVLSLKLIARSLTPLQYLTLATRQVAGGNLTTRVRIRTGDEFESLADAFNNMAAKLGSQISTLKAMSGIDRMILAGTKFEDLSEDVVKHLVGLTNCGAAAVIARDVDAQDKARMISVFDGEIRNDRIHLPDDLRNAWCAPQQITLSEADDAAAPYRARFLGYGQNFVVLIPVILNSDIKGVLLLGSESQLNMSQGSVAQCVDLAGRFAVALSSVEREKALYRQAHFDPLTCLPNRQLLKDRLEQHLASARVDRQYGAVLFLDLDRFKEINDMFGHSVGDLLLIQAAERIVSQVRPRDTVARLGGDEFVIVLPNVSDNGVVRATAERLLAKLGEAFSIQDKDHYVSASIGIVVFPGDGQSVELLLKNADAAMYRAKEAGRNRFEFFSQRLNAESRRKIGLERDLRSAFKNGELEVEYQPQFEVATNRISGAEALLRWMHPTEGRISPSEFIPLAEDSGLILEIGAWVLERACEDLRNMLDNGLHPGPMSINVSARQLRESCFIDSVIAPLRRFDIHPGYIQLEVTETTVAQNRDTAIHILQDLRRQGVRVAIDDFGTGYSSLSYLQQMPFDVIKIDKSFVQAIGRDTASDNICRTIIRMAAELDKRSIAEGAEDSRQVEFLQKNGCDFIQGFFYSRPLAVDDFVSFLSRQDFHTQRRKALELA